MIVRRTLIEVASTAILATVISLLALLPALRELGSAWGSGDMLSTYVNTENWGLFGFTTGNHFGYPLGMDLNLFPSIDITQNSFAALVGWITGNPFMGINLLLFLSFPLVAVLAYCSIRLTGLRGPLAVSLAVAFTMIPFHFARGLGHTSLATMYGAVTAVILAQLIGSGRVKEMLFSSKATQTKTKVTNYVILIALVFTTAWSGVYYAAFGLILMVAAWLWQFATNRTNTLVNAIPMVAVGVVAVAGFIPSLLALRADPPFISLGERLPSESVIFAGILAIAILAAPISRLGGPFAAYNTEVTQAFGATPQYENTTISSYGTWITLAALVFIAFSLLTRFRARLGLLGLLLATTVLFFIPWGLNFLFASLVTPQIRAWNRLIPVLLLLVILIAATILANMKAGNVKITKVHPALAIAVVILAVTAVESAWPFVTPYREGARSGAQITQAARDYTTSIGEQIPQNCGVLQLPHQVYPENGPLLELGDYEHFWTSIVDSNKSWSYGAVKNTNASAWLSALPEVPGAEEVDLLAQAGFCGIHLDTRAFVAPAAERIVTGLTSRYGPPTVTAATKADTPANWLFFTTNPQAQTQDPANWSPDLVNYFLAPAITTERVDLANMSVGPRGSKDALIWWWTITPQATFTIHPLDQRTPLTLITGGVRIPSCQDQSEAQVRLTLSTGETLITTANQKTTTEFEITLKQPTMEETILTVSTDLQGCQPADYAYPQYIQVIDLHAK
jgi:hypothetical protein